MVFAYVGPETVMPLTSVVASVISHRSSAAAPALNRDGTDSESTGAEQEPGVDVKGREATAARGLHRHGPDGRTFGLADTERRPGACEYRAKRSAIADDHARNDPPRRARAAVDFDGYTLGRSPSYLYNLVSGR